MAGDSYNAVVEGMAAGRVDVVFLGPVTFDEARRRSAAELLAVEETRGQSVYHAGWFHRADSGMTSPGDLRGKSVALGDPHSTSSFQYLVAMLLAAGIDPFASSQRSSRPESQRVPGARGQLCAVLGPSEAGPAAMRPGLSKLACRRVH